MSISIDVSEELTKVFPFPDTLLAINTQRVAS